VTARWEPTPEEAARIRAEYRYGSIATLAASLGIKGYTLYRYARRNGITTAQRPRAPLVWSAEKDDRLSRLYGVVPTKQLSTMLEVSERAVIVRAGDLHLSIRVNRWRQVDHMVATIAHLRAEQRGWMALVAYHATDATFADARRWSGMTAEQLMGLRELAMRSVTTAQAAD
jgi:hypothetical protein